jgi:hypothetical protein
MLLKVWAEGLSESEWERLTRRMEVRSSWSLGAGGVSVGGAGVVRYDDDIEEDEDWG